MKVFDLSEFQPDDRVRALAGDADGYIIKFGEMIGGEPELDPKFLDFAADCDAAGIPWGMYYVSHAHDGDEMMQEAGWLNDRMYELQFDGLPKLGIWWDMEVPAVCRDDVWPQLRDTIGTMEDWYGTMNVGIYAGYSYFNEYCDMEELAYYQIPVWVAQYGYYENSLKAEHPELKHVAWQYADSYQGMNQDANEWYGF